VGGIKGTSESGIVRVAEGYGTKEDDAGSYFTAGIILIVPWVGRGFTITGEGLVLDNNEFE
jgi:hypothetical protein